MLIGPTGSGKTLFAQTLAKILNVPFIIADATTLTESGYVGDDAESVLERLLMAADYDLEAAQHGIVYIDEIDKKAKRFDTNSNARDVSGEGVQQALLRLIEGSSVKLKMPNNKKISEDHVEFNTKNVLFIVSGAFVGLEDIVQKRQVGSTTIGFGAEVSRKAESITNNLNSQDIINFGIIPELMGRLPIIAVLEKLTEEQMIEVLCSVKNNLVAQYVELLRVDGIELVVSKQYLVDVAKISIKQDLGARALRQIVENSLISVMYRAPELHKSGVVKIEFNKYPVANTKPLLTFEGGKTESDTEYKLYRGIDE
jgi:ATP-dependent Clp protease ATP-binding subunit ClpX